MKLQKDLRGHTDEPNTSTNLPNLVPIGASQIGSPQ